jgi:hypothetical protein
VLVKLEFRLQMQCAKCCSRTKLIKHPVYQPATDPAATQRLQAALINRPKFVLVIHPVQYRPYESLFDTILLYVLLFVTDLVSTIMPPKGKKAAATAASKKRGTADPDTSTQPPTKRVVASKPRQMESVDGDQSLTGSQAYIETDGMYTKPGLKEFGSIPIIKAQPVRTWWVHPDIISDLEQAAVRRSSVPGNNVDHANELQVLASQDTKRSSIERVARYHFRLAC